MINQEIADILQNMASYLQMKDDQKSFFKTRAFEKAAEVISKFPHDLADEEWQDIPKLKNIKGIGQSVAEHIIEYRKTGKIKDYERMKKSSPVQLEELLHIQGIGPKKILKLYKKLGVTDIASLKKAAESGKIAELEGFGEKSAENILESIEFSIKNKDRISIALAEEIGEDLISYLQKDKNLKKAEITGSYRRKKETVGDLDILAASKDPEKTMAHFTSYPGVEKVLAHGDTKSSIWLKSKLQADIRIIPDKSWGAALQYFTGNREHNIKIRNIAIAQKYKLSEYGLFHRKSEERVKETAKEEDIYAKLGLDFIVPELREDKGELDAAKNHTLPSLITLKDLKGDLQMHTVHSDGVNTVREMAQKGKELGHDYIGITDHFGRLQIANAIEPSEFDDYVRDIRKVDQETPGIKIFASAEVEVDAEGNLEFPEEKLKKLDYIIAGIHRSTKMDKDQMTKRIIKVLENPLTTILAHPTGRIIGQRPGYEFDYEEVFKTAKKNNVAVEINAHPLRLDLNDELTKLAIDIGCKIVINTDAHSIHEMEYIKYGLNVARRGWVKHKNLFLLS